MGKIHVVGIGVTAESTAASATVTIPKGIVAGDLLILAVAARPTGTAGTNDTVTASGWSNWPTTATSRQEVGTADVALYVRYKVAVGGDSNPSVAVGTALQGATAGWSGQILALRGVDTSTLNDASPVASGGAASNTFTPTGITTVTNNALVLSLAATADDNALALSTAQGFQALMSGAAYDFGTGADQSFGLAVKHQGTAGAVTNPTWQETTLGPDIWVALTIALRPDASQVLDVDENWLHNVAGTAWTSSPLAWNVSVAGTGTAVTIASGAGREDLGTSGGFNDNVISETTLASLDYELRVDITPNMVVSYWAGVRLRSNGGNTYYLADVRPDNQIRFGKIVSGVETYFYEDASSAFVAGDVVHFRIRIVGTALKFRWWLNNVAEPGTWTQETTDSSITTGSILALTALGGSGSEGPITDFRALRITNVTSGTTVTPALLQGTGTFPSITAVISGRASPGALQGLGTFPAVAIALGTTVVPSVLAGVGTFGTVTIGLGTTVVPSVLTSVGTFGAVVVGVSGRAAPGVLGGVGTFPTPTLIGTALANVRKFDAVNDKIDFSAGDFASTTMPYGFWAAHVYYDPAASTDWQDIFHVESGASDGESGCIEISPSDQLWFGLENTGGSFGPTLAATAEWYTIVVVKPTGSVVPRFHIYRHSTSTWTHSDGDSVQANGTATVTGFNVGYFPGGFSWSGYEYALTAVVRQYVPNDAAVESLGLHTDANNWLSLASLGTDRWITHFGQASIGTAVEDLTVGNGDQVTIVGTTVNSRAIPLANFPPAGVAGTTVTPALLQGTGTFPQTLITTSGTAAPGAINGVGTFPSVTVKVSAFVSVGTLTSALTFPVAVPSVTGRALPAVLSGTGSLATPTLVASGTAVLGLLQGLGSFPAFVVFGSTVVAPTVLSGVGSFGLAAPRATGVAAPSTLAGVGTFPPATLVASGRAAPLLLQGLGAFLAPTPQASGRAAPTALQGVGTFGVPAPAATGRATPSVLNSVGSFFTPTILTTGQGTASPTTLSGSGTFGQVIPRVNTTVVVTRLNGAGAFGLPVIDVSGKVLPSTINGIGTFPVPSIATTGAGTATPVTLNGVGSFPVPTIRIQEPIQITTLSGLGSFGTPIINASGKVVLTTVSGIGTFGVPTPTVVISAQPITLQGIGAFGVPTFVADVTVTTVLLQGIGTFPSVILYAVGAAKPNYAGHTPAFVLNGGGGTSMLVGASNNIRTGWSNSKRPGALTIR